MSIWTRIGQSDANSTANQQSSGQTITTTTGTTIDPNALTTQSGVTLSGSQLGQLFGSGLISPAQLQGILSGIQPLSKEEQDELAQLESDYKNQVKSAKLSTFKKLHSEMRQFVINCVSWSEDLKRIENSGNIPKSERYNELEYKKSNSNLLSQSSFAGISTSINLNDHFISTFGLIGLPKDVSIDELKRAHLEATLEEEILDEQKE